MALVLILPCHTGPFKSPNLDGRWYALHSDESLGSTDSADVAKMLAEGECGYYQAGEPKSNIANSSFPPTFISGRNLSKPLNTALNTIQRR